MTSPYRHLSLLFVLTLVMSLASRETAGQVEAQSTFVKAARLLDVESGEYIEKPVITIQGDRIVEVQSNVALPPEGVAIDLGELTLLAGLIDAHTHLCIQPDYSEVDPILYKSIPYRTLEGAAAARKTLEAGFTTIRDIDSEGADWADVALRDAINDDLIPGPRMQAATLAISITGGYMNHPGIAPGIDVPQFGALADSRADLVREVRRQIKYGADFIKLYTTGSIAHLSAESMEPLAQYDYEDIKLVVDEAARFGKPVAAHAYGGQGAKDAIRAGVVSIEHGMLLDDETLDLMVEHGTYWVPTIATYFPDAPKEEWTDVQQLVIESHKRAFVLALEKGVRIAYGTDVGALPHGENTIDMKVMVEYGMEPIDVIRTATIHAADLMGWQGDVGVVKRGAYADLIAARGDPTDDVSVLDSLLFVMKGGEIVLWRSGG